MLVRLALTWCALSIPSSLFAGALLARFGRSASNVTPQVVPVHAS